MADIVTNLLLFTACFGLLLFIYRYYRHSYWRMYLVGRYVMYFMLTITGIFTYILIVQLIDPYYGEKFVNLIILIMFNYGVWRMVYLLIKVQNQKDEKETIDDL